mgnify:CR=1 FL=1
MKKTVSMLLAVLMAAIAVCTFGVSAFADETTTVAATTTEIILLGILLNFFCLYDRLYITRI